MAGNMVMRALPVLLLLAFACGGSGSGGSVVRWDASSGRLPDDGGEWERVLLCPGPGPEFSGGALRINSLAYRDVSDRVFYLRTRGLRVPRRFVVEASVRVVDELQDPFTQDYATGLGAAFAARKAFVLLIGSHGFRFNDVRREFPVEPGADAGFHTYRVEVDVAKETVVLYLDGVETARTGAIADPAPGPGIWWGDLSRFGAAISEWRYVQHNAGP